MSLIASLASISNSDSNRVTSTVVVLSTTSVGDSDLVTADSGLVFVVGPICAHSADVRGVAVVDSAGAGDAILGVVGCDTAVGLALVDERGVGNGSASSGVVCNRGGGCDAEKGQKAESCLSVHFWYFGIRNVIVLVKVYTEVEDLKDCELMVYKEV